MEQDYHADIIYLDGLKNIMKNGIKRTDRTGVGTIGLFGTQQRYDLTQGFPLLTSKKIYTRGVFGELLFFLNGYTNNKWLSDRKVTIWDEWQAEDGDLGPIYGYQWRNFGAPYDKNNNGRHNLAGVDQISQVLQDLKNNPFSRRHIISAWNPKQVAEMALPPCHTMFQFYVTPDNDGNPYGLSCQLYQRSADNFLGVPFNIASYAALTQLFAEIVGLVPLDFVHTMGDAHIYVNHFEQVNEQLRRIDYLPSMPILKINHPKPVETLDLSDPHIFEQYDISDFVIEGYHPLPSIKAEVAV